MNRDEQFIRYARQNKKHIKAHALILFANALEEVGEAEMMIKFQKGVEEHGPGFATKEINILEEINGEAMDTFWYTAKLLFDADE